MGFLAALKIWDSSPPPYTRFSSWIAHLGNIGNKFHYGRGIALHFDISMLGPWVESSSRKSSRHNFLMKNGWFPPEWKIN
jgi:hypothetical protein